MDLRRAPLCQLSRANDTGLTEGLAYSTKVVGNLTYLKTIARLSG